MPAFTAANAYAAPQDLQRVAANLTLGDYEGMNAYSEDLRKKIVDALMKRRMKKSEAAHAFGVSLSSVKRSVRLAVQGKPLVPKKRPGSLPKIDKTARRLLKEDLKARPAVSLRQRCEYLVSVAGVAVSRSTLRRTIKRLGYTRKKDRWVPQKGTSA